LRKGIEPAEIMEQEDYLKRQIDQIGRVLGKLLSDLLGLRSCRHAMDGIEISNQILKSESDIELQAIIDTNSSNLINVLKSEMHFNNDNLEKLANIFLLIDNSSQGKYNDRLLTHCLTIFEYLENADRTYSIERQLKIKEIRNRMNLFSAD